MLIKIIEYAIVKKRNNRPQGVDLDNMVNRITTPSLAKVPGWFFYVKLLTKRKYECKQCQNKHSESH